MPKNDFILNEAEAPALINKSNIDEKLEKKKQQKELENKKSEIQNKLQKTEDQMYYFAEKYGIDYPLTQLMASSYEISLKMQEYVNLMDALKLSFESVFDTINIFDSFNLYFDNILKSTTKAPNFINKIKAKIEAKKTMANIESSINELAKRFEVMGRTTASLTSSLNKAMKNLNKKMNKKASTNTKIENNTANDLIKKHLDSINDTKSEEVIIDTNKKTDDFSDIL